MKDLIEVRLTLASAELKGKTVKAIAGKVEEVFKHYEKQITRIVESFTKAIEKENEGE